MTFNFASVFQVLANHFRTGRAEDLFQVKNRLRPRILYVYGTAGVMLALAVLTGPKDGSCQRPASSHADRSTLPLLSQNDDTDQNEVSTDQIKKYVSVYKAMQRNRSLTIDQAAAQQGLTVQEFRELENRVQRDDAALQQARDELQAAAKQATPAGNNHPPAK